MYQIKFDFPNLPKGGEIDITGLNNRFYENGKTYAVSEEEAEQYRVTYPVVLDDGTTAPGPTLLEAFKDNKFVTVTTKTASKEGDK